MEQPLELLGFDDSGRLPLPAQPLEISRRHLSSVTAAEGTTAVAMGKKATSKRFAVAPAPKQPAPEAARRHTAGAFQELKVERLEELGGRLSQLKTLGKGNSSSACARQGPPPQPQGASSAGPAGASIVVPSVLGQAAPCLSGATACARARALLGRWSTHWRPQGPAARSNCRYACWNTECAGRSSGRWCKSWEHSAAHRQRVGAETGLCGDSPGRFRVEPSDRKFSGGIRGLFRGPVLPRGVRGWKTRETGAGGKGGENSQREARGGHCCSRRQGTQGPQRPRGRIMVLAQTRRRVLGACFHCVATSAASEGSSP